MFFPVSSLMLGKARVLRAGNDVTSTALAAMVPEAVQAADELQGGT